MVPHSPLDDPHTAAHAWARFRQMMRVAGLVTLALVVLVVGGEYVWFGRVSISVYIGTALGIGLLVPMTAALMGLMFLSSGTGHDQAIADSFEDEEV
jgi:hypothetical protein